MNLKLGGALNQLDIQACILSSRPFSVYVFFANVKLNKKLLNRYGVSAFDENKATYKIVNIDQILI